MRPRQAGAFSLIELIAVLAIMSLALALSAPTLMRAGSRSAEQRALAQLVDALRAARAEAIVAQTPVVARMAAAEGDLLVEAGATSLRIEPWPLESLRAEREAGQGEAPAARAQARDHPLLVRFAPSGRTAARGLTARSAAGDRLWRIAFDRVSGAPSLALAGGKESP